MSDEKKQIIKHPATKEEFETILKGGKPVLVDFYAEWCGPCQMMGPILEEMVATYKNIKNIEIVKLDIDKLKDVAIQYEVMSVPTFIIFDKEGKPTDKMIGMRPTEEFERKLDQLIENNTGTKE